MAMAAEASPARTPSGVSKIASTAKRGAPSTSGARAVVSVTSATTSFSRRTA
jgi:hypothetical protein